MSASAHGPIPDHDPDDPPYPSVDQDILDDLELKQYQSPEPRSDLNRYPQPGMAKLHALLSKDKAKLDELKSLGRAKDQLRLWNKCQADALEILSLPHDEEVDVFPFFALPTELRLLVYQELLVTDDRLILSWRGPKKANKHQKRMYIAILMTCRLCANEGLATLYGENVFDFEEICGRPTFVTSFVKRLKPTNLSLIRIIVVEHSAASEELMLQHPDSTFKRLSIAHITAFLAPFNISLSQLRCFAVSLIPYGFDDATTYVMKDQLHAGGQSNMSTRIQWLDKKNAALGEMAEQICERVGGFKRVEFGEIDRKICFDWCPPFMGRPWLLYEKGSQM
ncbi:uncharacterized protein BDR25DRAFT_342103 [Lindgomyces ingoldianus]|uniref:Uncharacterized protein n=1 Tax=Lindgomyces ingoldianus TaxID=673940 RepID=A0ACB6QZT0_9PLEO|nr:uncharacterized protein BDR25DRAFT_342103 [Lindgomyces ingoldianus]KAF2472088.1 hypothetical protein BDR25DRAFT_342103 [Lindgomyces ingoldianus]